MNDNKSKIRIIIEDIEIQIVAAIDSIDKGYNGTAIAELNGAKMMIKYAFEEIGD